MVSITAEIVSFSWETWIPLELPLRPEDEFMVHSILNVSNEVWFQVIQMSGSEQHIAWTTHAIFWEDTENPILIARPSACSLFLCFPPDAGPGFQSGNDHCSCFQVPRHLLLPQIYRYSMWDADPQTPP